MIEALSALDRKCVFSRPNLAIGLGKLIAFASQAAHSAAMAIWS